MAIACTLLRAALATADRLVAPRLSILILHRVVPELDPLFPHEMHAARFDALLTQLKSTFQVLTLGDAHALWSRQALPARALAITFDDGYADNAEVALPILQKHGLRATFFVSTGFLDGGRMWNDTVIETLRACSLPQVDLSALGLGLRPLASNADRRAGIDAVLPLIKYKPLQAREPALAALLQACAEPALPDNLMMRSDQVQLLHAAGMEIGAHTVRHPILTATPDDAALAEISVGRAQLQRLTGAPVDVFAYPNGRPSRDYDRRHVEMVRQAGFRCAVSTAAGTADAGCDPLQWPRFTPWDASDTAWLMRLTATRYARGTAMRV